VVGPHFLLTFVKRTFKHQNKKGVTYRWAHVDMLSKQNFCSAKTLFSVGQGPFEKYFESSLVLEPSNYLCTSL
jgi:hypothetical protein